MADEYTTLIVDNYDKHTLRRVTGVFIAAGIILTVTIMVLIGVLIKNN